MSFVNLKLITWDELSDKKRQDALGHKYPKPIPNITEDIKDIIANVKNYGDKAIKKIASRYDGVTIKRFKVSDAEIQKQVALIDRKTKDAIIKAYEQLKRSHQPQLPSQKEINVSNGIHCTRIIRPIEKVGFFIPQRVAPLLSMILMLAVPANIAGCKSKILCTPPARDGCIDPRILFTAHFAGIDEIYKIGGPQAIAAMAYGSESVPKVDKIFGGDDDWITKAKALVSRDPSGCQCDISGEPLEIMIIADDYANPEFVALELLAQAEQSSNARIILVSTLGEIIDQVNVFLNQNLKTLPRRILAKESIRKGIAILIKDLNEALKISNQYAPGQLILYVKNATQVANSVVNAGSVFIGNWSSGAFGYYLTGANRIMPPHGLVKTMSSISVESFIKQIYLQKIDEEGIQQMASIAKTFMELEGLSANTMAIDARLKCLQVK